VRVLIVDDAAFMRIMLRKIVITAGHDVVGEASDGLAAVEMYRELRPDLTTLDITMPGKDGIEVLEEIMGLDPEARVLMCSAIGQQAKVVESLKLGARDFVVKPFDTETVEHAIAKALAA
jgi:two-component system chemotaxis response regulator CheY